MPCTHTHPQVYSKCGHGTHCQHHLDFLHDTFGPHVISGNHLECQAFRQLGHLTALTLITIISFFVNLWQKFCSQNSRIKFKNVVIQLCQEFMEYMPYGHKNIHSSFRRYTTEKQTYRKSSAVMINFCVFMTVCICKFVPLCYSYSKGTFHTPPPALFLWIIPICFKQIIHRWMRTQLLSCRSMYKQSMVIIKFSGTESRKAFFNLVCKG